MVWHYKRDTIVQQRSNFIDERVLQATEGRYLPRHEFEHRCFHISTKLKRQNHYVDR